MFPRHITPDMMIRIGFSGCTEPAANEVRTEYIRGRKKRDIVACVRRCIDAGRIRSVAAVGGGYALVK